MWNRIIFHTTLWDETIFFEGYKNDHGFAVPRIGEHVVVRGNLWKVQMVEWRVESACVFVILYPA